MGKHLKVLSQMYHFSPYSLFHMTSPHPQEQRLEDVVQIKYLGRRGNRSCKHIANLPQKELVFQVRYTILP